MSNTALRRTLLSTKRNTEIHRDDSHQHPQDTPDRRTAELRLRSRNRPDHRDRPGRRQAGRFLQGRRFELCVERRSDPLRTEQQQVTARGQRATGFPSSLPLSRGLRPLASGGLFFPATARDKVKGRHFCRPFFFDLIHYKNIRLPSFNNNIAEIHRPFRDIRRTILPPPLVDAYLEISSTVIRVRIGTSVCGHDNCAIILQL